MDGALATIVFLTILAVLVGGLAVGYPTNDEKVLRKAIICREVGWGLLFLSFFGIYSTVGTAIGDPATNDVAGQYYKDVTGHYVAYATMLILFVALILLVIGYGIRRNGK
ncbi:MAG TPA: hypothetical protein VGL56_10735 [Fimbriimonadaceae bacterium]|jgi:hypothetical protein